MKRFLVFKLGALGDVLMTTPLVRLLSREGEVDYLVGAGSACVLQNNPHISKLYQFDESILFRRRILKVRDVMRPVGATRYDAVFVLDKHWIFSLLAMQANSPLRVGFRRDALGFLHRSVPFGGRIEHEVDNYLSLAGLIGLSAARAERSLVCVPGSADVAHARNLAAGPYVVLCNNGGNNPGEQSDVRKMPPSLFEQIVLGLTKRHHVVFVGLKSEFHAYDRFIGERTTNLCGRTEPMQAVALLMNASGVITTDCGVSHMAASVNPRVLVVFGPTHPERKCPPGARYVWQDESHYSFAYEDFGSLPQGPFFGSIDAAQVLRKFESM